MYKQKSRHVLGASDDRHFAFTVPWMPNSTLLQEKSRSSTLQYSVDDLQKKLTQTYGDLTECEDKVAEIETSLKAQVAKEVKVEW